MGYRFFRQSSVGVETTPGTFVQATRRLQGRMALDDDSVLELRDEERGSMGGSNTYDFLQTLSRGRYDGNVSTDELLFWLWAGMRGDTVAVGTAPSVYTFTQPLTSAQLTTGALDSLTLYAGDDQQCVRVAGCYVTSITITGGTNKPWTIVVEFFGRLIAKSTFTTLTQPVNRIAKNLLSQIYIDTTGAGIGGTVVTPAGTFYEFTWKHDTKITPDHAMEGTLNPIGILRDVPETTLELTGKWNTAMVAEFDAYLALTRRFVRIRNAGTSPHRISLDGCYSPMKVETQSGDMRGTTLSKLNLAAVEDSTWTKKIEIIVETD